jgi:hypothetical protein
VIARPTGGTRFAALLQWEVATMPWVSVANVLIGLWLMLTPLLLGTSGRAADQEVISGCIVVAAAVISALTPSLYTPAAWINVFVGIWVAFGPAIVGYSTFLPFAASSDAAAGLAITIIAAIRISTAHGDHRVPNA